MRVYNKALDCLALATSQLMKGKPVTAGQLLVKASKMPDVIEALKIIEASNKEAHTRQQVEAARKQQAAKKPVRAAEEMEEDDAIKGLVGDDNELGECDEKEVDSAVEGDWGDEEPGEALDTAIGKEDAEITAKLAQVLSTMTKRQVRR